MRQVVGTVAVVTTDGPSGRFGATVTAFCSVSADPPTVLVCLRTGSRICEAAITNGVFTLNILPESAQMAARAFAGEFDTVKQDRFDGIALIERGGPAPLIEGALGFSCLIERHDPQASHTILIGKVREIVSRELLPLTYHDGAYCGVGRQIDFDRPSDRRHAAKTSPAKASE